MLLIWVSVFISFYNHVSESSEYIYVSDMNEIEKDDSIVFYYSDSCEICIQTKKAIMQSNLKKNRIYFVNVDNVASLDKKIDFVPFMEIYKNGRKTEEYIGKICIINYIKIQNKS